MTCKDLTEIEGIVYETPDNKENPEEKNPELDKYFKDLYIKQNVNFQKTYRKKLNK